MIMIQYKKQPNNTVQYNPIQSNPIQYVQYNAIQFNTIQCNATRYNTIQYNSLIPAKLENRRTTKNPVIWMLREQAYRIRFLSRVWRCWAEWDFFLPGQFVERKRNSRCCTISLVSFNSQFKRLSSAIDILIPFHISDRRSSCSYYRSTNSSVIPIIPIIIDFYYSLVYHCSKQFVLFNDSAPKTHLKSLSQIFKTSCFKQNQPCMVWKTPLAVFSLTITV